MRLTLKKAFSLIALTAFLAPVVAFGQSLPDSMAMYRQALNTPASAEKVALLKAMLTKYPGFLQGYYALGAEYYKQKQYDAAIPLFERILVIDKNHEVWLPRYLALAYNEVAMDLINHGYPAKAIDKLQRAIALYPDVSVFHYNLGNANYQLGRYGDALQQYKEAVQKYQESLSREPENLEYEATIWYNLGTTYYALADYSSAKNAYETALKLNPTLEKARAGLQKTDDKLVTEKQRSESSTALSSLYQKALQAKAAEKWAEALAILKTLPEDYKEAAALKTEMEDKIRRANAEKKRHDTLQRAVVLLNKGDFSASRQLLDEVLRNDPDDVVAKQLSARLDTALAANRREEQHTERTEAADSSVIGATVRDDSSEIRARQNETRLAGKAVDDAAVDNVAQPIMATPSGWRKYLPWMLVLIVGVAGALALVQYSEFGRQQSQVLLAKIKTWVKSDHLVAIEPEASAPSARTETLTEVTVTELSEPPTDAPNPTVAEVEHEQPTEEIASDFAAGPAEILEIGATENGESLRDRPGLSLKGFSDEDAEEFLSLIVNDELDTASFVEETDKPANLDHESTRTVDMSQFRLRKIGRYIIEKEIGRGAAGRVYKAWDPKLDRTVVLKTVSYSLTASADEIKRLKSRVYREARAAAKLSHPNIVVVFDVEDEASFSYIVMEFVDGPNLRELLDKECKLAPARAISFVMQVCKAIHYAHAAGIVHRDIKPSNILLLDNDKVKVTDFGIAKVTNHLTLTQTGKVVGTPSYMAPEQIEGNDVDGRADIFSLGVVFYELLTGKRPFVADSLAALAYKIVHVDPTPMSLVNLEIPDVYDEIITRAMAKNPAQRYQTAAEFLDALKKIQTLITS